MNLPSFRRAVPALALAAIALVMLGLPQLGRFTSAGVRYDKCARLTAESPNTALTFAHAWRIERPASLVARHCEAIALFAAQDYAHAADALSALAKDMASDSGLAARLMVQEGRAWLALGQYEKAANAAQDASKANPANEEAKILLIDINQEKDAHTAAPKDH
jgi:hypothetical protein